MTSALDTSETDDSADPTGRAQDRPGAAEDGDIGARGRLSIADRVIEKIAGQAAGEVDRATGTPRSILGVPVGGDERAPSVSASSDGVVATVHIAMSIIWPAPIREVTRQVRQRVSDRLAELAGITESQVDIRVGTLASEPTTETRVN